MGSRSCLLYRPNIDWRGIPNSAATSWFDPHPLMPALVDDFAELKLDSTMRLRA